MRGRRFSFLWDDNMLSLKHRLRIARRIEEALNKRRCARRAGLEDLRRDLNDSFRVIQTTCQLLEKVVVRGWTKARGELVETLTSRLYALSGQTDRAAEAIGKRFETPVATVNLL